VGKTSINLSDAKIITEEVDDEAIIEIEIKYVMKVPRAELGEWKAKLEGAAHGDLKAYGEMQVGGNAGVKVGGNSNVKVGGEVDVGGELKGDVKGSGGVKIGGDIKVEGGLKL